MFINSQIPHTDDNINEKEVIKFEKLATRWWILEGEFKILHRINPLRLNYIAQRSGGLFGKKILEVGCGGGILAESMVKEGAMVTGLDIGFESLQAARFHSLKSKLQINYVQETVEKHVIKHAYQYDIVTCMEMLEHVPDPKSVVESCAKLVKKDGKVFFSTINRNRKAWFMAILVAEYLLRMIPKGTHDIKKFIKPAELLSWSDKTRLQEQHIIGLHYNFLMDKFYLGPGIDVNYILHMVAKNN